MIEKLKKLTVEEQLQKIKLIKNSLIGLLIVLILLLIFVHNIIVRFSIAGIITIAIVIIIKNYSEIFSYILTLKILKAIEYDALKKDVNNIHENISNLSDQSSGMVTDTNDLKKAVDDLSYSMSGRKIKDADVINKDLD